MVSFMDSNGDRRTVGLDDLVGPFQPCDSMILWFYAYFIKPNYFGFFFFFPAKVLVCPVSPCRESIPQFSLSLCIF